MKIAAATDDGKTIARHFGGSSTILVLTVEEGKIVKSEERQKLDHGTLSGMETHLQTDEKGRHGFGPDSEKRHSAMFDVFKDCEVLLVDMMIHVFLNWRLLLNYVKRGQSRYLTLPLAASLGLTHYVCVRGFYKILPMGQFRTERQVLPDVLYHERQGTIPCTEFRSVDDQCQSQGECHRDGPLKELYGKAEQVYHGTSLTFTVKQAYPGHWWPEFFPGRYYPVTWFL